MWGVRILQVLIYVTVSSLSWFRLFQFRKKFLGVSLLVSGGGHLWGHAKGVNKSVGCQNSEVFLV